MDGVTVEVKGLKELEDALTEFAPKLVKSCFREAMNKAADPEVQAAKERAPLLKDPLRNKRRGIGELRDSIVKIVKMTKGGVRAKVGPKRNPGEGNQKPGAWGLMVEFGSIHNPPMPYLRPAFDATKQQSVDRFAAVLKDRVSKMGKK